MELRLIRAGEPICPIEELSDSTSLKFRILEEGRAIEAFLIRFSGRYYAYKNRCAHMALTLDLEDNDFFTIDCRALICKTHGAVYFPESGICFSGPCYGETLEPLPVELRDGQVILVETSAQ
jgi:nitrite reductase/ring-hydroxylating ferredoxin subunit